MGGVMHVLLGGFAALILFSSSALALSSDLDPMPHDAHAPASGLGLHIHVMNGCDSPREAAVFYMAADSAWRMSGWRALAPRERAPVAWSRARVFFSASRPFGDPEQIDAISSPFHRRSAPESIGSSVTEIVFCN